MNKLSIIFGLIFLSNALFGQQLPQNSPLSELAFYHNPAMTAVYDFSETTLLYQQSFSDFEHNPKTAFASFQYPFVYQNMSLGAAFINDQLGNFTSNGLALSYSYKLHLGIFNADQLSIGINGTFWQYRLDFQNFIAKSDTDNLLQSQENQTFSSNVGAGLFYTTNAKNYYSKNQFYLGFAANQLLPNDVIFDNNSANLQRTLHANTIIGFKSIQNNFVIEPNIWILFSSENLLTTNLNLKLEWIEKFWGTIGFSSANFIPLQFGVFLPNIGDGILKFGGFGQLNFGSDYFVERGVGFGAFVGYSFEL